MHRNLDGTGSIHGVFDDPAAFAPILTALDARTRPSAENRGATVAEKNAAALVEICEFALRYQHDGKVAGERPHVTVTIGLAELEARARGALLDMGGELTPGQLRRMLCDARILPVVLGKDSEPLDIGRAKRTIPTHIRRAVATRDHGCAHPGCDRPPSWCEVHHVIEWQHGGPTDVENLVMLCGAHHDQIHSDRVADRHVHRHTEVHPTGLARRVEGCGMSTAMGEVCGSTGEGSGARGGTSGSRPVNAVDGHLHQHAPVGDHAARYSSQSGCSPAALR